MLCGLNDLGLLISIVSGCLDKSCLPRQAPAYTRAEALCCCGDEVVGYR